MNGAELKWEKIERDSGVIAHMHFFQNMWQGGGRYILEGQRDPLGILWHGNETSSEEVSKSHQYNGQ